MGPSVASLAAREVYAELFEFPVQVRAFKACFFSHPGHGAAFMGQMKFKIGFFEGVTRFAQWAVEFKTLLYVRCRDVFGDDQAGHGQHTGRWWWAGGQHGLLHLVAGQTLLDGFEQFL